MAEGLLEGALGGEEEKPEAEAPETLTGVEAFAAAIAAKLAGSDPEVARDTSAFLKKQAQLLEIQAAHLKDEQEARLHFLRGQAREVDIRRFGLCFRVGFQCFLVLVATVFGVGGVILIHDAVTSRSVVIEPFETPRSLGEQGLTGTVVASGVLDQLSQLQAATRSSLQRRDLSNAWSNEIKLTVPEAGISLGEISRLLRSRFGHDIHISGDVVQTAAGALKVTVRGNGLLPRSFTGASDQLDNLTAEVAEYVYAQSQPALWATFLVDSGRYRDAIEFCRAAIDSVTPSDRPAILTFWAVAIAKSSGIGPQTLALARRAIELQPDYWAAYDMRMIMQFGIGDEEGAIRTSQALRKVAGGRPGRAPEMTYETADNILWDLRAQLRGIMLDSQSVPSGTFTYASGPVVALIQALLHDRDAAEFALQATIPDTRDPTIAANSHFARGLLASEEGDSAHAASEMEAFLIANADPAVSWQSYPNCFVARAEEAAGHPDKADAILNSSGTFVDCHRFRGDILDSRGDWKSAQEWYAKSVTLAPDLPAGYYSWGVALARHGDLAGAARKLKDANQRGPHWADPLKAWGDVLVKQGNIHEALAKYDEALMYAPNWKQLKEAREAVAKQKS